MYFICALLFTGVLGHAVKSTSKTEKRGGGNYFKEGRLKETFDRVLGFGVRGQ